MVAVRMDANPVAQQLVDLAGYAGLRLATAESCTGGMISAAITDIVGSSAVFDRGFVTYSNEAKITQLGISAQLIKDHGAVSAEVAEAMARAALGFCTDGESGKLVVSVTGIAGPGGGSPEKPVGLVWFGLAIKKPDQAMALISQKHHFKGERGDVRINSRDMALDMLMAAAEELAGQEFT